MLGQQLVVSLVRFEPGGKKISHAGYGADKGIDEEVGRHAEENHARNARPEGADEKDRGKSGRGGVSNAGNETDDRIESEAVLRAGDGNEVVEDECEDPGEFLLARQRRPGGQHLHFDFLDLRFHRAFIA